MDELLNKIIKTLGNSQQKNGSEKIIFKSKKASFSTEVSKDSFVTFEENSNKNIRIAFVDGGNGEIIGGSSFSLQKIRVVSSIFLGKEIQKTNYSGFDVLCISNGTFFDVESNPKQDFLNELKINNSDFLDKTVSSTKSEELCGAIRRISELQCVLDLIEKKIADMIVIDGSLNSTFIQEKELIKKISSEARKQKIIVVGISKSSELSNEFGIPAGFALDSLAKEKGIKKNWYVNISIMEKISTGFVKLNKEAKSILRIDYFEDDFIKTKKVEILSALARASSDPVFLGYPFGLIDADDKARITKEEIEEERIRLKILSGKNIDLLERAMATKESHEILDNIRF